MLSSETAHDEKVSPSVPDTALLTDLLPRTDQALDVEVSVHDRCRFQWQLVLPIPVAGGAAYEVEAEFEIPSNALSGHSPWDLMQGFTRFDGDTAAASNGSLNALRQKAVWLARMLERARHGFARHCREVIERTQSEERRADVMNWLEAALRSVSALRASLAIASPEDSPELSRERGLADEFISVRLLEFLADAQQFLTTALEGEVPLDEPLRSSLEHADERLAGALETELAYRRAHGFESADPGRPGSLEKYVERAGRLKKHFQDALALDREAYPLDDRVQQWVATFSALLAGMLFFGAQLLLRHWSIGSQLSSGLAALILLAGIAYAARDRLKELGSAWIRGKVYRFHAQRVVLCRLANSRDVVVRAREWLNETTTAVPDPLNPESGASMRVTLVHHLHRGKLISNPEIIASGAQRIRQVFRYDLSPLFARLHDPVKRVPVLDPTTRRAAFVDAPRRYQLPIRLRATMGERQTEVRASLMVDKLGIQRLERLPK